MKFISWILSCAIVTIIIGSTALLIQQTVRLDINNVLVQITSDATSKLAAGRSLAEIIPDSTVDPRTSTVAFVTVYDEKGVVVASSMDVSGLVPSPPVGVFDRAWEDGKYRVTWQPVAGARIATVIERVKDKQQFVLAGMSLREVESHLSTLMWIATFAWIASLILITIKSYIDRSPQQTQPQPKKVTEPNQKS